MVCIPCIVAPVLLFLWYRFLQPIMLRFWNPWGTKTVKAQPEIEDPLANLKCPFLNETESQPSVTPLAPEQEVVERSAPEQEVVTPSAPEQEVVTLSAPEQEVVEPSDKKND